MHATRAAGLRRGVTLIGTVAALSMASVTSGALAQPAPDAGLPGMDAFQQGLTLLREQRWVEAVPFLEEAVRVGATPLRWYDLALAYRGAGRPAAACAAFERYLAQPEAGASPERLAAIRDELAEMQRVTPRVELTLDPPDAALRVDGRALRPGPEGLRLDPGAHALDVEAEGFERYHHELTLTPGARVVLAVTLRPLAPEGHLVVEPSVPGASVTVDAQPAGSGRVDRVVAPGDHVIEVRATGHDPWRRTVHLAARSTLRVDAALTPAGRGPSRAWVLPVAIGGGAALVVAGIVTAVAFATRGEEAPLRGSWGHFMAP